MPNVTATFSLRHVATFCDTNVFRANNEKYTANAFSRFTRRRFAARRSGSLLILKRWPIGSAPEEFDECCNSEHEDDDSQDPDQDHAIHIPPIPSIMIDLLNCEHGHW
jgi:hypothetical protein